MSILQDKVEKANTELAKRWVRILYLEDVVANQNAVNLRQASEILGNRAEMKQLQGRLAAHHAEVAKLAALLKEGRGIVGEIGAELVAREKEIADLIHPHDLAKYRSSK